MADVAVESFDGVVLAIDAQSAFGTVDGTIRDLNITTPLTEAMGVVVGYREAGDAESGITLPSFEPFRRELAAVGQTQNFANFVREAFGDLVITYIVKGNGATITNPVAVDDCKPAKGIDALNQIAGLSGTGVALAPVYRYTPAASETYATIKMWWGDLSFCWQDCIINTRSTVYTPGETGLRTDTIKLGAIVSAGVADGIVFTSPTAGPQTTMAAPAIEGVVNTWNMERGWNELTITINNNIEEIGNCNVADTGIKFSQKMPREITASVKGLWVGTTNSDYEYEQTKLTAAPTDGFTFQVGTVGIADATANAYKVTLENPVVDSLKYDRLGTDLVADVELSARDATAAAEYTEDYN
jgi:hypothetical protein